MIIKAKSFAKVNPHLKITGLREDGYHALDLSFLSINLADELSFRRLNEREIKISTDADISPEENLCFRVAKKLQTACNTSAGAKIDLEKEIPIGGGLGGGSSNAATTLICLNRLWECNMTEEELAEIGKNFGADISFFFRGGYCAGRGIGEEIQPLANTFQNRLIPVFTPSFSQSTPEVYSKYDRMNPEIPENHENSRTATAEYPADFEIENDLQLPAIQLNPELKKYLNCFEAADTIQTSGVAGSGSSLFGIAQAGVKRDELEEELSKLLKPEGEEKLIITRPTENGQKIVKKREDN